MMEQLELTNPIARKTDPASSHEAARNLSTRNTHALVVLDILIRLRAALTSHEIAFNHAARTDSPLDSVKITKRLNDLVKHNPPLVEKAPIRPCRVTKRNLLTWRAI